MLINTYTALGDVLFAVADNPPTTFSPQLVQPEYSIETVVPGGQNCPSDVTVTADGHIYLAAVRSRYVYEVVGDSLSDEENVMVYSLQAGIDGNLYGYFPPAFPGTIYQITPGGTKTTVGTLDQTSCESPLAVAPTPNPNPDLWVGWNGCGGEIMTEHKLFRIPQGGAAVQVTSVPDHIYGLDFDSNGNLFMTALNASYDYWLYQVDTASGALTELVEIPAPASFHGLAVDDEGNKYIGTSWNDTTHSLDDVYKVNSSNELSLMAQLPAGCLNGLDQDPTSSDLFGTQRCTGALFRIHLDDSWEIILPGNGMSTPDVMAFNPTGELFVNNNESGTIVKINGNHGQYFTSVWSFTPPFAAFAFLPWGEFYYTEAAPGGTPYLSLISPDGGVIHITEALDFPSGLIFDSSGQLYAVEYMAGTIVKISSSGMVTPWVSGLTRPQPLAIDNNDFLYVGDYSKIPQNPGDVAEIVDTDRLWQVDPSGLKTQLLEHEFRMIAISPYDQLFITGKVGGYYYGVLEVNSDRSLKPIAIGFLDPVGLAFDVVGNLYVADLTNNSIHRITGFRHGFLEGHITNSQTLTPIPQAITSLVTEYPLIKGIQGITDINGFYNFVAEPRQYTLTATAYGYCMASATVTVAADQTTTFDLVMQPCPPFFLPLVIKP
jgi:sugar lactone lactonase YvrE